MYPIREKPHRLPAEYYLGYRTVSFTANLKPRIRAFTTSDLVTTMEEFLLEAIEHYHSDSVVHLFMPDHAHFILQSRDGEGDVLSATKRFKQRSSFWLVHNKPGIRWQKDFHDHIIRTEEDLMEHIRYILANPVRAGLVGDWKDYPFRGSTIFDLDSWTTL